MDSSPEGKFRDGMDWKGAIVEMVVTIIKTLTPNSLFIHP